MRFTHLASAVFAAPIAFSLLTGCQEKPSEMVVKSVGPDNIKAGVRFNVQPDGSSALWIISEGVTSKSVPILSGVELPNVAVRDNGTLVTAVVPEKLYEQPGSYPLSLVDKETGVKSNEIFFVVE